MNCETYYFLNVTTTKGSLAVETKTVYMTASGDCFLLTLKEVRRDGSESILSQDSLSFVVSCGSMCLSVHLQGGTV